VTASQELPRPRRGRPPLRDDIQALRALAVLLVLAYHLWPRRLPGGYVGVDVFFVISGYLITGQLAREAAAGGISFSRFWIRRSRRLLPSALLVLGLSALATLAWLPERAWRQTFREISAATLYVQNWILARDAADYFGTGSTPSLVQHYWSLSIEEQFYVALPLLISGALALRLPASRLALLLGAVAIASLAWSVHLTGRNQPVAYFVTTTRAWEFAVGGILATAGWRAPSRLRDVAVWGGLAMIVFAAFHFDESTSFPGWVAALPVLGAALVLWAAVEGGLAVRLAGLAPVQTIGDISYALYLWHWPLILLFPLWLGEFRRWHSPVIAALAVLLAWLTTRFVEDPIRHRPIRRRTGWRLFAAATVAAATVLAIARFGQLHVERRAEELPALAARLRGVDPLCFGAAAMTRHCPPPTQIFPDVERIHLDGANRAECWSNNGESTFRICRLGPEAGHVRRLIAIGDSHNNALISAYEWIAQRANWRIDVAGKGGCYLTTAPLEQYQPEYRAECSRWLEQVRSYLRESAPYDALVVTHFEGFPILLEPEESQFDAEVRGLVEAWGEQAARGVPILAIKDVPTTPRSTIDCVRRLGLMAERECAVGRRAGVRVRDSQVEAVRRVAGARLINLDDLYCGPRRCSPVVGGVAVYHRPGHLTGTFAFTLAPYLLDEIRGALD
jgi:peptidoglycan/LPS O-acetylase OafA/YrhL